MKIGKIYNDLIAESIAEQMIENLLDEDYPTTWNLDEFKKLNSFSQRIKYCQQHLQRISSGSSRIVYKIDNEKVLKLAKNQKGLAQNDVEATWGNDRYFESILAHTFDYHQDNLWVEMELARKVPKATFRQLAGFDVEQMYEYLDTQQKENTRQKPIFTVTPEEREFFGNNELVSSILDFMLQVKAPAGDFCRLSSWGLVNRDGHDTLVLIDFGLTGDVYTSYYS